MFIKGMDISTLIEEERCGARYFDNGVEKDALSILKDYGANSVRLRLWNDPYTGDKKPYGAGTNDIEKTIVLAKRAKELGMSVLLDLHYSDFWADPGKQTTPKAWQGLSLTELTKKVYEFTAEVVGTMKNECVSPELVQVGNEITNGLLWPLGQKVGYPDAEEAGDEGAHDDPYRTEDSRLYKKRASDPDVKAGYDAIEKLVSAGIRGVRSAADDAKIMIHLDNGGFHDMYVEWFENYFSRGGEDFDIIGMSYYPFWHGTMDELDLNMRDMYGRYKKEIVIAEVSMGFSMEDYRSYEGDPDELIGMATKEELLEKLDYPMTKQGQCDFMQRIMEMVRDTPGGRGFYYWEPAWIPVPGCGWATPEALEYTGETGRKGGNEWANQALFDYEGNALPALKTIRDF